MIWTLFVIGCVVVSWVAGFLYAQYQADHTYVSFWSFVSARIKAATK